MTSSGGLSVLLLDTDVFSFIFKGDSRGLLYSPILTGHRLALSFVTVAEIFQWAALHKWGARRLANAERALQSYILVSVADREMCRIWAEIRVARRAAGHLIAAQDAWVAATALRHNLPLVTHNSKDFQGIKNLDLRTLTP